MTEQKSSGTVRCYVSDMYVLLVRQYSLHFGKTRHFLAVFILRLER